MANHAVNVTEQSHRTLQEMAERSGEPVEIVLDKIIEESRRRRLLEEFNEDYARLRADPKSWAEELEERKLWEGTLMDGLEPE